MEMILGLLFTLAQQGMRFTSIYNTSRCFSSRACLLTGIYAHII